MGVETSVAMVWRALCVHCHCPKVVSSVHCVSHCATFGLTDFACVWTEVSSFVIPSLKACSHGKLATRLSWFLSLSLVFFVYFEVFLFIVYPYNEGDFMWGS